MQIRSKANQTRDNEILLNLNVQACHVILRFRGNTSSSPVLCKKSVFKNFAKLPGKLLPWSIFLIKLQVFSEGLFQVFRKIITRSCSIKTWCYVIRHKEIKKMQKGLRKVKTVRSFCIWQIRASQLPNIFTRKGIIRLLRTQNFFEKRTCAYQGLEKLVFRKFRVRTKWIVPKCRRLELTQFKIMRNKVCSLLLTL